MNQLSAEKWLEWNKAIHFDGRKARRSGWQLENEDRWGKFIVVRECTMDIEYVAG